MEIVLNNIGKRYRFEWIFKGIDYQFNSQDQYAIKGPNGAGKSTFLKIISGFLSPSKGEISFMKNGQEVDSEKVYQEISFCAPYVDLIEEFTLKEMIDFHQKFKSFKPSIDSAQLIEIMELRKAVNKPLSFFSSGMKQRAKLALAICSESSLLILDEPTTNLDVEGIDWYRNLIENYAQDQTVIIASNVAHDFDFCANQFDIRRYKPT